MTHQAIERMLNDMLDEIEGTGVDLSYWPVRADVIVMNYAMKLADAVSAEREACAKIADDHADECDGNGCTYVADCIRARGRQ